MAEPSQKQSGISRRTIVRGAAWAAPVVAMANAAPAFAASTPTPPRSGISGWMTWGVGCSWKTGKFTQTYTTSSVKPQNPDPNTTYGLIAAPTKVGDTIENGAIIFWVSVPGLSWTAGSGSSQSWTVPVSTGTTRTQSGQTLYGYKTTLTGTVVAKAGTTRLPDRSPA